MSFLIRNDEVWQKYEDIWNIIKNQLNIKFHSEPIYENKYLKAKVREFDDDIKTNFLGNGLPKDLRMNKKIIHQFIQKSVNTK